MSGADKSALGAKARADAIGSRKFREFLEAGARQPSPPSASGELDGLQQMLIIWHNNARMAMGQETEATLASRMERIKQEIG